MGNTKICSVGGCEGPVVGRKLCRMHYQRWWKHGDANRGALTSAERFWACVDKSPGQGPKGECWTWTKSLDEDGYGRINVDNKHVLAHRYAFFLEHGHYPEHYALHHCDYPTCVRASHLYDGTHAQNMADRQDRNRQWHPSGEKHGASKLTEGKVLDIRARAARGEAKAAIASRYKISRALVTMICQRQRWKHI